MAWGVFFSIKLKAEVVWGHIDCHIGAGVRFLNGFDKASIISSRVKPLALRLLYNYNAQNSVHFMNYLTLYCDEILDMPLLCVQCSSLTLLANFDSARILAI